MSSSSQTLPNKNSENKSKTSTSTIVLIVLAIILILLSVVAFIFNKSGTSSFALFDGIMNVLSFR